MLPACWAWLGYLVIKGLSVTSSSQASRTQCSNYRLIRTLLFHTSRYEVVNGICDISGNLFLSLHTTSRTLKQPRHPDAQSGIGMYQANNPR